ncbi:hypothetical protein HanIR_Chr11g0549321 [Helianthus annuus]|nr:hypothetical protein HanIR_Chr11g0549321 [Helianthus annuus]
MMLEMVMVDDRVGRRSHGGATTAEVVIRVCFREQSSSQREREVKKIRERER